MLVFVIFELQAKTSSDCHSNIIFVKEEEKCLEYLVLLHLNTSKETGRLCPHFERSLNYNEIILSDILSGRETAT